jgi:hydrogenase expression/formation protein HypD
MSIARFGLKNLLPKNIRLISGPGCPVCVTDNSYLDHAIALAKTQGIIIATFGDMMRVPASTSSLAKCRAGGADIRVVTSTIEALEIAEQNPDKEVVFLGVGFETTTPTIAASIKIAKDNNLKNYSVLCANKLVPPALGALLSGELKLDGFLLPGHVSTIIGADAYLPIIENRNIACAVAGFEPADILKAIADMTAQISSQSFDINITYSRAVGKECNPKAVSMVNEVFEICDASWRGIGTIPASGLKIRKEFSDYDAFKKFTVSVEETIEHKGCRCGEILQGLCSPQDCPLFKKDCTPENPIGACMVSSEGTCAAYYTYCT